ncbi:hypothetical protein GCM10009868_06020 [Terrabacter aerolatus]|uniref:Uncharacterized protein n=1 Tax=Terrabacter aerolatus TaxID=422442 RepID=A0A512D0W8_9MICO|nr:hypothetical protein [Terrabacter aerolatus]GEO30109.1 hypothetical protein TAE01_19190 [Terrabacter aerolatus]
MGSARRRNVVVTALLAYAVLLLLGPHLLGAWAGGIILVASFAVGFTWLVLLVAPWAARGRPRATPVRGPRP